MCFEQFFFTFFFTRSCQIREQLGTKVMCVCLAWLDLGETIHERYIQTSRHFFQGGILRVFFSIDILFSTSVDGVIMTRLKLQRFLFQ